MAHTASRKRRTSRPKKLKATKQYRYKNKQGKWVTSSKKPK